MQKERQRRAKDHPYPLGLLVNRTAYVMRTRLRKTLGERGMELTPEECALLFHLWLRDGQTQSELAAAAIRERTTLTRILDGLVRAGLVERREHPGDRRKICAWLTQAGIARQDEVLPIISELIAAGTAGIPRRDLELTIRTLLRIQENLLR